MEKNPTVYASVLERFPERSERVTQLLQVDAGFREMCADYQEMACWLATYDFDGRTVESACIEGRQLLAELEAEILAALQAAERQSHR